VSGTYTPVAQLGRGAKITFLITGASGTPTAFLSLVSVKIPPSVVGEVENQLLVSTITPYLPTLPDAEGSFKVQHWDLDPGCLAMQQAVAQAPVPTGTFVITLLNTATFTFTGFPKKYEIDEITNPEIVTAEIDVRRNSTISYMAPGATTAVIIG
jgi:hypothetical protein